MVDIIKSRDGRIVECNPLKITSAIGKAGEEIWEFGGWEAEEPTLWVLTSIHELHFGPIPNVVEIQEIVERLFHHSPLWGIYEYLQLEYHQSIVW